MQSVYRLHTDELDERLLNSIKLLFEDKMIEIRITDVSSLEQNGNGRTKDEMDETDYLLSSPANRKHLLAAIDYVNSSQPLIEVDMNTLIAAEQESEPSE
jgi:antitoxin YefM